MRIRHSTSSGQDKIELQMTPMIDIVFQLLVFFIMTFKIVSQEGDFNIKMPQTAPDAGMPQDDALPPMHLRLVADSAGNLADISLNDVSYGTGKEGFQALHLHIIETIGSERGPGSRQETAEVELDCDYDLRYEHVIDAITAVSGYIDSSTGKVISLVEKVKFTPLKEQSAASGG